SGLARAGHRRSVRAAAQRNPREISRMYVWPGLGSEDDAGIPNEPEDVSRDLVCIAKIMVPKLCSEHPSQPRAPVQRLYLGVMPRSFCQTASQTARVSSRRGPP